MEKCRSLFDVDRARERNYIGSRIEAARRDAGWSLNELSVKLEQFGLSITNRGLSKWENGNTVPNGYQLMAVARALGIHDLLTGYDPELNDAGMRKLKEYRNDLIATGRYAPSPAAETEYTEMPVSLLPASAGPGMFLEEETVEKVRVPKDIIPAGAVYGVRIAGDSMEPAYHDGQIVWVEPCDTLRPGEVGIFGCDGNGYIKVLGEQEAADQDTCTGSSGQPRMQPVLISFNPKYDPIIISPESEFKIFGRVLRGWAEKGTPKSVF